jgi:hypothetical protein
MKHILTIALLTTAALAWPLCGQDAADVAPPAPEAKTKAEKKEPAKAKKPAAFPFRGTLKAVDKDALTLTLAGKEKDRVIHITSQTRFTKDGKPATLGDAILDGEVAGSARKTDDGRTEAVSVRFGPAPAKSSKPARTPKPTEEK